MYVMPNSYIQHLFYNWQQNINNVINEYLKRICLSPEFRGLNTSVCFKGGNIGWYYLKNLEVLNIFQKLYRSLVQGLKRGFDP